ncbi:cytoskeleton-associated protein 2 [Bos taurus]|uniref:Cytoskeleton-associated protein 2 n=1 Tax=Bos taurus TaxID=9913 RepID=CKAP2_BOVIN|nr:cytoskeleton-associated protein 2 [Bos taurus]A5D7U0.1 RecName: Full=Cytoskeleton-associated protein 2 [Bos taurus]AAI40681.1 CKAP2 protein [Bos taurus]
MSTPAIPQDLQLNPSQRTQSAFREQRRQKLKEHLLKRKTSFACKQENQMLLSDGDQRVRTSEGQIQEGKKVLKIKTEMADKENVGRPTGIKNNLTVEKNCIPLKPSNELTNSTLATDPPNSEDNNQTLPLLPVKDDPQSQHRTLSQTFHLKNNSKKKPVITEKPKHDANVPKKPVLGAYRGQIVQSKINSFRKPLQVKDESSATTKKLPATVSKATKPQPGDVSSITVKSDRASHMTSTTKFASTTSQIRHLVRPPIRSQHNKAQDAMKPGNSRMSANVTVQKGPREKELNTVLSGIKTSSSQDIKGDKTLSKSMAAGMVVRPASSSNTKLIEKSKSAGQRSHTTVKAAVDSRWTQPKETAEERKARLSEWKAGKGRILKRPPSSAVTRPEPETQNEQPVGSFWTTMAEEDEQRLFTEKVNKTFSECLNLINEPIEEMRHTIVDILTRKSQEKLKFGENIEETSAAEEKIQEAHTDDTGVDLESGKLEMENNPPRNVFQDCEKEQDDKVKDPTSDVKTPSTNTRAGCLIKYNVSTTPYLQSVKKKMQFDETNSAYKELKFLTPVRRSRRLQEKTSKLPDMLKDHYPCVSSLEQLTELGCETDAFVCRPNTALCGMFSEPDPTEEE